MEKFFSPKSVAVIGASNSSFNLGATITGVLTHLKFDGKVYDVNVKGESVNGVPGYKTVFDIEDDYIDYGNLVGLRVIKVSYFFADRTSVKWTTEFESGNTGFNVYRAESEDGEYVKVNAELIPSKGSSGQGASYEFVDEDAGDGETYYYRLENVDIKGDSTMHKMIK